MVVGRFGSDNDFMLKVNPSTQIAFGEKPTMALTGDYPTLYDINTAYGKGFSTEWLIPHIVNLSQHAGAKNLTNNQIAELARQLANEYKYLKVTEVLLFFYRFKNGYYGRFYGQVDPMVITCAFREFMKDRNLMLDRIDKEQREEKEREEKNNNIPKGIEGYKVWLEMKKKRNEQSELTK